MWVWQRARDGSRAFPLEPVEIEGRGSEIAIDSFGVIVPLGEIYRS